MPYSYAVYTGNGATTQFALTFPYIRKEHVYVSVNYTNQSYTWVNDSIVQLASAPANGARVEVRRVTPVNLPLVDFTDGSTLVAADLDTNALQQVYTDQEQDDQLKQAIYVDPNGNLTASNQRIKNVLDPIDAQDAATKNYVDTRDALKVSKAGDSMTGALAMGTNKVTGVGDPTSAQDAATKNYVDANDALKVSKAGDSMTGALGMGTNKITGLGDPTSAQDGATKNYVDTNDALKVAKAGDSMTGALAMGTNKITGLGNPTAAQDAATKSYADTTFWNKTTETIDSTEVWSNSDSVVATTSAVNARIVDLLNDIGSYEVVTNEVSLPNAGIVDAAGQPDANVLVAVTDATGLTWNGSGTSTNATRVNGSAVTITGITGTSPITNCGMQVLSTGTLHTYTFVRFTVGTAVAQLISDNINEILQVDSNAAAAAASQSAAASSASAAASSASAAATSASNAATSATNALNSATAASSLVTTITNLSYLLNWGLITEAAGTSTDYGAL